jgi:hypothetical protein
MVRFGKISRQNNVSFYSENRFFCLIFEKEKGNKSQGEL